MVFERLISEKESKLLEILIRNSGLEMSEDWKSKLLVRSMDDNDMGSLLLFPNGEVKEGREFGGQVSEFLFKDIDGIEVIASLNIDKEGNLFELDIWKTDFSSLRNFPDFE
ncbi:DUF6984 family protein [Peijinzhouia sedimentorum]